MHGIVTEHKSGNQHVETGNRYAVANYQYVTQRK